LPGAVGGGRTGISFILAAVRKGRGRDEGREKAQRICVGSSGVETGGGPAVLTLSWILSLHAFTHDGTSQPASPGQHRAVFI
jgi:hypothetical protein